MNGLLVLVFDVTGNAFYVAKVGLFLLLAFFCIEKRLFFNFPPLLKIYS